MVKTVDGIFMGLFSVISLIGIMGNLFAIYVVIKGKLLKRRLVLPAKFIMFGYIFLYSYFPINNGGVL